MLPERKRRKMIEGSRIRKRNRRKEASGLEIEKFQISARGRKKLVGKNREWHFILKFYFKFIFDLKLSLNVRNWSLNVRFR